MMFGAAVALSSGAGRQATPCGQRKLSGLSDVDDASTEATFFAPSMSQRSVDTTERDSGTLSRLSRQASSDSLGTPPSQNRSRNISKELYGSQSSQASTDDSEDLSGDTPWQRLRTPSPENSYYSLTGRSPPPPPCLILPVALVPVAGFLPSLPVPAAEGLPSVGSEGHSTGTCRPCAHSWRLKGCSKGRDCTYCHLCDKQEFDLYKKNYKVHKGMARKAAQAQAQLSAELQNSAASVSPPSVGSAGHGSGKCRPCAHTWRPGGCAKGASCSFCHICDEEAFVKFRELSKAEKGLRLRYGASA